MKDLIESYYAGSILSNGDLKRITSFHAMLLEYLSALPPKFNLMVGACAIEYSRLKQYLQGRKVEPSKISPFFEAEEMRKYVNTYYEGGPLPDNVLDNLITFFSDLHDLISQMPVDYHLAACEILIVRDTLYRYKQNRTR